MAYQPGILQFIKDYGLSVRTYDGWTTRGNSTFNPRGVVVHHTGPWSTVSGMVDLCIRGRSDLPGPLAQVVLSPDGVVHLIAAGRANHAGLGGWQGLSGNSSVWGIEAIHAGSAGTPWPQKQLDAYYKLCAAMIKYSKTNAGMVCGHKEWRPGDKIDPITNQWGVIKMNDFRRAVQNVGAPAPAPLPGGAVVINRPPIKILTLPEIDGYAIISDDGGVFTYGNFPFLGSLGGVALSQPIVDAQAIVLGGQPGYFMMGKDGAIYAFGSAKYKGRVEYRVNMLKRLAMPIRRKVDPGEYMDGCPGDKADDVPPG